MNASRFNRPSVARSDNVEDDGEMDEALSNDFLAVYLNVMIDKQCKSVSSLMNVDLDNSYAEEMTHCKKLLCALKRTNHASAILEDCNFMKEDFKALSSLSDVSDDAQLVMNPLKSEFEKLLNQLPMKGFQTLSDGQLVPMVQKLKDCDELLSKTYECIGEELQEKSALTQYLRRTLDPDLLPRKEKCDSLVETICNTSIKESAYTAAKTAGEILEKRNKTKN